MARTFPLSLTEFQRAFQSTQALFHLAETLEAERTVGGDRITGSVAERFWYGSFAVRSLRHDMGADQVLALMDYITDGYPFLVSQNHRKATQADPLGTSFTGAAAPGNQEIIAINANRVDITIRNLPPNAVITQGDLISFQYNGEYFMRRAGNTTQALPSGTLDGATLTLTQAIDADIPASTGAPLACQLVEPFLLARYREGSLSEPMQSQTLVQGFSFMWDEV